MGGDPAAIHYIRGRLWWRSDDFHRAAAEFTEVLKLDPRDVNRWWRGRTSITDFTVMPMPWLMPRPLWR